MRLFLEAECTFESCQMFWRLNGSAFHKRLFARMHDKRRFQVVWVNFNYDFMRWRKFYALASHVDSPRFDDLLIWEFWWIAHRGAEPKLPDSRVANMDMPNFSCIIICIITMKCRSCRVGFCAMSRMTLCMHVNRSHDTWFRWRMTLISRLHFVKRNALTFVE